MLCLEKNAYVGGMAGTREILTGCRNDVGASLLFPLAKGLEEELELARYGVEFIDLPIMASNLNSRDVAAGDLLLRIRCGWRSTCSGTSASRAMIGFVRLMAFCKYPASLMDRFTPRSVPPTLDELLARAPDERKRRQIELAFTGSAMDLVDRFLPDVKRHRTLRALVAFAAVQSTYKGPFTPGSALCLVYTFAQNEGGGLMRRVKGGMGSLSEALCRSIADKGGEVRLKIARAARPDRGRARGRRRAARRAAHHGARGALEPRQAGDLLRAGGPRAPRRGDHPAHRAASSSAAPTCTCSSSCAACRATVRPSST